MYVKVRRVNDHGSVSYKATITRSVSLGMFNSHLELNAYGETEYAALENMIECLSEQDSINSLIKKDILDRMTRIRVKDKIDADEKIGE